MSSQMANQRSRQLDTLVDGLNRFGDRLFLELCRECPEGNLFFSPSSVAHVLAMTWRGAAGSTRRELSNLLGFDSLDGAPEDAFRELSKHLAGCSGNFNHANRLWAQTSPHYHHEFELALQRSFDAMLAQVDFRSDTAAARAEIDRWIQEQTANRYDQSPTSTSVDASTRMVLTNVCRFRGRWEEPFDVSETRDDDFYLSNGEVRRVPMMHRDCLVCASFNDTVAKLNLPYSETRTETIGSDGQKAINRAQFIFQLILPFDELLGTTSTVEYLMTREWRDLGKTRFYKADILLPKFRFNNSLPFVKTLHSLGLKSPFSVGGADFSRLTAVPDGLFLSQIAQNAFVDLDEFGTDAAAATGGMVAMCRTMPLDFRANRPFVFRIVEVNSGLVHFFGRIEDPSKS